MRENINKNTEKISANNIENSISSVKGAGGFSGENLLRQYRLLAPEAKKIATEEMVRYFNALNTIDYYDNDLKRQEMAQGAHEIMQDARLGIRARLDESQFEPNKNLTEEELESIQKQREREERDEKEEQDLLRKIEEGYKKLLGEQN